ncbi:MAG: PQQ-dependent sugar dehydrogenase [Gammaproteobacteria bacterium]|nr:PQQ-dependent sugar dehydrogenase [Gammaproteobacteria bacterium]
MKFTRTSGIAFWTSWHCIAVLALVLIPGLLIFGKPAWSLSDSETTFLAGIALSYITCVLILTWLSRNGRAIPLRDLVLVILAVFGVYYFLLLLTGSYFSRPVLLSTFVFAVIFILLSFSFVSSLQKPVLIALALVTLLSQFMAEDVVKQLKGGVSGPQRSQKLINTEFYNVNALIYKNQIDGCPESDERCGPSKTSGGGISVFDDGYLLATGEGDLYFLMLDIDTKDLESRLLEIRIPLNADAFQADNGKDDVWLYRVTDILVQEKGKKFRLFAAYHHWKSDERCSVMRISSLEVDYAAFLSGNVDAEWQTIYDSEPCLPVTKGRRGDRFKGADSGGRMVLLDDSRLLFSVGDYQVDGWNRKEILAQNDDVSYGKTVLIDLDTGAATIYSSGHRNPQGLFTASDGSIWLTEHGPRGGDELNLVLKDANYGWPMVTYGTEYGEKIWPISHNQGQHEGYQRPIFAWVPSIAVSNVIAVEDDLFPLWKGDLLVASYKQSLWRLRVREGRVIYIEPVQVLQSNGRIRDIMEDKQGRIVLWLDGGSLAILEPLDQSDAVSDDIRGQILFVQCTGCHNIKTGGGHPRDSKVPGIGPDLLGVAGSTIAASPGYSYTNALKELSGTWSAENLDRFLKDPQGFAPGTNMQFQGIADADDRKKLIQYLTTLK